ncbi:hypothetical protein RJJ65_32210 [Rhizobium hidalgonense]|uniref:Uncharacterized protein n=1 Tax=Rhizobium hidalgonense TaxID=1538159 RepID=A0AAJ2H3M1_9HYPH|nr:hypothetical protein [Rhizobium hidalgonense]MDR9777223.1 hypothetical protein [Rhizobium hidalgonense]
MTNKHIDIWEEIVSSEDEKTLALKSATSNGLQWTSTSRVESPDGNGFIPGIYRMRFAKAPKRNVIKFSGYDPTEKRLGRR